MVSLANGWSAAWSWADVYEDSLWLVLAPAGRSSGAPRVSQRRPPPMAVLVPAYNAAFLRSSRRRRYSDSGVTCELGNFLGCFAIVQILGTSMAYQAAISWARCRCQSDSTIRIVNPAPGFLRSRRLRIRASPPQERRATEIQSGGIAW